MRRTILIKSMADDTGDETILGAVLVPTRMEHALDAEIRNDIRRLWNQFVETEPDCDSDFIYFLDGDGYHLTEVPMVVIVIA